MVTAVKQTNVRAIVMKFSTKIIPTKSSQENYFHTIPLVVATHTCESNTTYVSQINSYKFHRVIWREIIPETSCELRTTFRSCFRTFCSHPRKCIIVSAHICRNVSLVQRCVNERRESTFQGTVEYREKGVIWRGTWKI